MLAYHHQMAVECEHYGLQSAMDGADLTAGGCSIAVVGFFVVVVFLKWTDCIKEILELLLVTVCGCINLKDSFCHRPAL